MSDTVTVRGRAVGRPEILAAIAECERLGKGEFLRVYGYRDSVRWHLRHNGRSYPSKAILGVASGLDCQDFFGGAAHTVSQLAALGFHVRNSETGELADAQLDFLRRACEREGLSVLELDWPVGPVVPSAYFASGSNQPGEIRGLSRAGADVGVTATFVAAAAEAELHALAGSDVNVFVDSGAFSEVKFGPEGCTVVKPITAPMWRKRLGLYKRLAASLGSQVFLVAPDRVGSQAVTLERLETYRAEVVECRRLGARILVAMQKGELSQVEFAARVDAVLGFSDWLPALPCKKAATSAAEVAEFVRQRQPRHVHLLGLGIRSKQLDAYLAPFSDSSSTVSLDSCWITANVGKTNGPGKGPRRLTQARVVAEKVLAATAAVAVVELAVYCCFAVSI